MWWRDVYREVYSVEDNCDIENGEDNDDGEMMIVKQLSDDSNQSDGDVIAGIKNCR